MLCGHQYYLVCHLYSGHCSDLQNSQGSVPEPNASFKHSALSTSPGYFTLSPCHKEIRNCSN